MTTARIQRPASSLQLLEPQPRHDNGRKMRIDALPEHIDYHDSGCDMAPTCLRCPLAQCRYDEPGSSRKIRRAPRDTAVQRYREEGVGIDALATRFGMSRRSVFRILARGRTAEAGIDLAS